jgi:DNA-binding response OmpR family regulator
MAKIMAADDDLEMLELLRTVLETGGHEVTTATDGRQALRLGETKDFDLYILDVTMPYMDGYHVASELSDKFPDRKILLLTSRDYDRDKMAVDSCGADAHMSKPFDMNELLRVVKNLVGGVSD